MAAALVASAVALGREWLLPLDRFDFLKQRAGFQIAEALVPAGPLDPVWFVLFVGLLNTLLAALCATALAIPAGIVLAVGREAPIRLLGVCATTVIELVRNTPVLLQLFLWYAILTQALPGPRQALTIPPGIILCNRGLFLPWFAGGQIDWPVLAGFNISGGLSLSPELTALSGGLAVFHGCYLAEIFRAGIRAVPQTQREAAYALGLGHVGTFREIVLPQALGFALPSIGLQIQSLVRNSALAVAIGFPDFVSILTTVVNRNGRVFEALILICAVFLAVNTALGALVEGFRRRPLGGLTVAPRSTSPLPPLSCHEVAAALALVALAAPWLWALLRWTVVEAAWTGPPSACTAKTGACWAVVSEKLRLLLVGLYPAGEAWRPTLAAALVAATTVVAGMAALARRPVASILVGVLTTGLAGPLWLFAGGWGLIPVPSVLWGGLSLTILLGASAVAAATALALPLALARRSPSPGLALCARGGIGVFRSVPLVALLLASDLLLPQILPPSAEVPKLVRAFAAVALLAAVNLAEVLRGALDSVPAGQRDAARALGLSRQAVLIFVVLPQALQIALPAAINVYVGAIKDTSLVAIVGLFDVTGAAKAAVADPSWMRYAPEIYLSLAAVYFALCFPITRFARRLERQTTAASPSSKRSMSAASL